MTNKITVTLQPPPSTDAGSYGGIDKATFQWDTSVDAVWGCHRQNGVLISGEDFILLGGSPDCFNKDYNYVWGTFTLVEN